MGDEVGWGDSNETAVLTELQMNAGDEGVEKEHEDDHGEDGHALHQQHRVGYPVLGGDRGQRTTRGQRWCYRRAR